MSSPTIKFLTVASASIAYDSDIINITGGVDCYHVYSGTVVIVGNDPVIDVIEGIEGTSPDVNGNSTITLREKWKGSTISNKPLVVYNSNEGLAESIRKANEIVGYLDALLDGQEELLTSTEPTVTLDINGVPTEFVPYGYLVEQLGDVNEIGGLNDRLTTLESRVNMDNVNLTKLDAPLFQGFQPNKLVTVSAPNGDKADVIHTRASTATYIDRYGVLKTAGIDELRETADGYQIEAVGSTNAWNYSEGFTHSSWGKNSSRVELSPADDLSNLLAYKIIPNASESIKSISHTYESVAGDTQSMTLIVKAAELGILNIGSNITQSSSYYLSKINLFDGSIISGGEYITQFRKIEKGAYIVTVTFPTENSGVSSPTIQIFSNSQEPIWASNDSDGIIFYAGQIENRATPSSYIPTTDAPATRAPDIVHTAYENNVPRGDQPYTIIFKGIIDGYTNFNRLFDIENNGVTYRITSLINETGNIFHSNGLDANIIKTVSNIVFGEEFTYIVTSNGTNYSSYLNGEFQAHSDVIAPATQLPSEMRILQGHSSSNNSNGKCSLFKTLPYAINADEAKLI